jgi:hypothetical protein
MTVTITGTYESAAQARNAGDDLVNTGIDQEKVFVDEDNKQVKVMVSAAIAAEIKEILNRHKPTQVT